MRRVHLFLPVKGGDKAKTRLGARLSPERRRSLVLALADGTFAEVTAARCFASVTVMTNLPDIAKDAEARGWRARIDDGHDLNAALPLTDGLPDLRMILPVDLPYLDAESLRSQVSTYRGGLVIGASGRDGGTTFLLGEIGRLPRLAFGETGSAAVHAALARSVALPVINVTAGPLTQDLDTAEDFEALDPSRVSPRVARLIRASEAEVSSEKRPKQ